MVSELESVLVALRLFRRSASPNSPSSERTQADEPSVDSAQYAGSHPLAPIARRGAPSTPNTKAGEHHKKEPEANIQKRNWWIFQEILGAAALTMADRVLLCPDRGRDQYIDSNINPAALPSSPPPTHCTYNLPLQTRCKTSSVLPLVEQPCPAAITFTR